jgi:hypothetical protein
VLGVRIQHVNFGGSNSAHNTDLKKYKARGKVSGLSEDHPVDTMGLDTLDPINPLGGKQHSLTFNWRFGALSSSHSPKWKAAGRCNLNFFTI